MFIFVSGVCRSFESYYLLQQIDICAVCQKWVKTNVEKKGNDMKVWFLHSSSSSYSIGDSIMEFVQMLDEYIRIATKQNTTQNNIIESLCREE